MRQWVSGDEAENRGSPEVEIEQSREKVDAAQGTVELEVIARETLTRTGGRGLSGKTSPAQTVAMPRRIFALCSSSVSGEVVGPMARKS